MFGNPETTTGGRALKFYASVRLDVRRVESLKVSGEAVGNHTKVKVVKNKVAPPFKETEFDIMFGKGISYAGEVLDLAVSKDIIKKSGAWFSYQENKIGQGRENTKKYLEDHPQVLYEVDRLVRESFGLDPETARRPDGDGAFLEEDGTVSYAQAEQEPSYAAEEAAFEEDGAATA